MNPTFTVVAADKVVIILIGTISSISRLVFISGSVAENTDASFIVLDLAVFTESTALNWRLSWSPLTVYPKALLVACDLGQDSLAAQASDAVQALPRPLGRDL